jgi:hypothetical protein
MGTRENDADEASYEALTSYGYGARLIAGERVHKNDVPDAEDVL